MKSTDVSLAEARRIAVRSQLLDGSATGLLETVRRLGFLQIDPISTVAPPQYLVPWSRLGSYDRAELDRLLAALRGQYEERTLDWVPYFHHWLGGVESPDRIGYRWAGVRTSTTRSSAASR